MPPSPQGTAAARLRLLVPVTLCMGLAALGCAYAEPAAPQSGRAELRLEAGAATYLRFVITPGYDRLVIRQLRADGALVEAVELQDDADQPAHLSWIVSAAGVYRFTVSPREEGESAGVYAVALEEQRPAGECDIVRLRAERAVAAARLQLMQPGGDPVAAQEALKRAEADAATVGELHAIVAAQLEMGRAAARLHAADAAGRYEKALALAREIDDRQAQAVALEALAHFVQDRPRDAAGAATSEAAEDGEAARRAFDLEVALGALSAQADSRQWRGYRRQMRGDIAAAIAEYQLALAAQWRTGNVRGQAWTLTQLGVLHGMQGDAARARSCLELGFERARAAGDRAGQAAALRQSALLNIDFGDLQAASDDYRRAYALLSVAATPDEKAEAALALHGRGTTYLYLGEPGKARKDFAAVIDAFEALRQPDGRASAYLGMGAAWQAENQPALALTNFAKALEIIDANGLQGMRALALYLLGKAHAETQPVEAVAELERALSMEAAAPPVQQAQTELARSRAGQAAAAASAFRRAIELAGRAPVVEAAAQAGLAREERASGELEAARLAIERAIRLTEELRAAVIRPDQRVSFLASRREYFETYVDLLMRLDRRDPGVGHAAEAIAASEQARARGLLDLLARQQVDLGAIVPGDLKVRQQEIGDRIAALQTRLLSPSQNLPIAGVRRVEGDLAAAEEEERDLAAEVDRRRPGYAEVRVARPLALARIQRLLDARTAFLEYFVGTDGSYLFVVTPQSLNAYALPPRHDLEILVGRVASAVQEETRLRGRHFAADAFALYRLLVLPAAADLSGRPRLIIAPDGPLNALSFETLLTQAVPEATLPRRDLPYLIRQRSVSYVPSASVLAQLLGERRAPATAGGEARLFVGFGDPGASNPEAGAAAAADCAGVAPDAALAAGETHPRAPGDPREAGPRPQGLPPLPAAHDEVCRIASLFPAGRAAVFLGAEATEENVKQSALVASARTLHFASHGLLDEQQPERSGLQLARGGAGSREDGLLQVREVFNLELQADLVVLSACRTGLGKEVSGEGLLGMTRAFLYAGAASVVVSLWPVDDDSTSDLMVHFYRHLLAFGDRAEALRQAKLDLLDDSPYSHPYFWAPFILIGRTR
jgi:CHAT domain-containing protein/tetratricopeptide (TPR) repeat protein